MMEVINAILGLLLVIAERIGSCVCIGLSAYRMMYGADWWTPLLFGLVLGMAADTESIYIDIKEIKKKLGVEV